jgi:hypothetical protein
LELNAEALVQSLWRRAQTDDTDRHGVEAPGRGLVEVAEALAGDGRQQAAEQLLIVGAPAFARESDDTLWARCRTLLAGSPAATLLGANRTASAMAPAVTLLLQLSSLICALPWVRTVVFDPVHIGRDTATIAGARVVIDPSRRLTGYRHMAIHLYPIELVGDAKLRDGTVFRAPDPPEDADSSAHSSTPCPSRAATSASSLTPRAHAAMLARFPLSSP